MCQLLLLKVAPGSERIENEGDGEKQTVLIYFSDRTRGYTEKKIGGKIQIRNSKHKDEYNKLSISFKKKRSLCSPNLRRC